MGTNEKKCINVNIYVISKWNCFQIEIGLSFKYLKISLDIYN